MNVVILGSGNVATILAKKITYAKHCIKQIYSRDLIHAQTLANSVKANAINALKDLDEDADMYIIALTDKVLEEISEILKLKNKLVVHTAGSVSGEVLKNCSTNYGVLYPIQSVRKNMDINTPIPFAIDANNKKNYIIIEDFAKSISEKVIHYTDEQRLKLHVAAVIACNFVNYLYLQSATFCEAEHLDFTLLQPLIEETANRLQHYHPSNVFTGPAVRGDINTIDKHLELLAKYPAQQKLYETMSHLMMAAFNKH